MISSGRRQRLRCFCFLDNQVKHFSPCVVKSPNLIFGVTRNGISPWFLYSTCVLSTFISSPFDLSALLSPFWLLMLCPLLLVTSTYIYIFLFPSYFKAWSLFLFWQTCLSLLKFSLFRGILSPRLPPGLSLFLFLVLSPFKGFFFCFQAFPVGLVFLFY